MVECDSRALWRTAKAPITKPPTFVPQIAESDTQCGTSGRIDTWRASRCAITTSLHARRFGCPATQTITAQECALGDPVTGEGVAFELIETDDRKWAGSGQAGWGHRERSFRPIGPSFDYRRLLPSSAKASEQEDLTLRESAAGEGCLEFGVERGAAGIERK